MVRTMRSSDVKLHSHVLVGLGAVVLAVPDVLARRPRSAFAAVPSDGVSQPHRHARVILDTL